MAKTQTRRSISVSGDTYNAVRDYCDEHGVSASGLVTELLDKFLKEQAGKKSGATGEPPQEETEQETKPQAEQRTVVRAMTPIKIQPPQAARDVQYPDRRGPGFKPLPEGVSLALWRVTAEIEIARKRQLDAQSAVETLLQNLIHRRMVNAISIVKVEKIEEG